MLLDGCVQTSFKTQLFQMEFSSSTNPQTNLLQSRHCQTMATHLTALPTEIAEIIAHNLKSRDLLNLRLVCRVPNEKTIWYAGHTLFSTLLTDLSRASLERLNDRSERACFKYNVRTLLIQQPETGMGEGFEWVPDVSGYFKASTPATNMLLNILLNGLVRCRSFRFYGIGDVNWLVNDLQHIFYPSTTYPTTTDAVGLVLTIIAETSLPVESFHVLFEDTWPLFGTMGRVSLEMLRLPPYQTSKF